MNCVMDFIPLLRRSESLCFWRLIFIYFFNSNRLTKKKDLYNKNKITSDKKKLNDNLERLFEDFNLETHDDKMSACKFSLHTSYGKFSCS